MLVMALPLLGSCSAPSSYRYELVLEVETPDGLRTGSGVIEVTVQSEPKLLPDMSGRNVRVHGEAVAVDLADGQTLIATLEGEDNGGYAEEIAARSLVPGSRTDQERMPVLTQGGQEAIVQRQSYPFLVRLRDPRDPRTIEGVNPDNLAASFGPGVRLRRILIRTTSSEPSFLLQRRYPWLGSEFHVAPRASNGVRVLMTSRSFQRR
jgi:hypothetical protein